jgi:hypothetical protein
MENYGELYEVLWRTMENFAFYNLENLWRTSGELGELLENLENYWRTCRTLENFENFGDLLGDLENFGELCESGGLNMTFVDATMLCVCAE